MAAEELAYAAYAPVLKAVGDDQGVRILEGIASDESVDLQDEVVPAEQLEKSYDYLQDWGTVNLDHGNDEIGEVMEVRSIDAQEAANRFGVDLNGRGTYVKCKVFPLDGNSLAPDDLKRAHYLINSGARLGFSMQGSAIRRPDGIQKVLASGLALTPQPVNPNAQARVVKSVSAAFDVRAEAQGGKPPQIIIAPPEGLRKAMETGHSINPDTMTGAAPLRRESLEGQTRGRNGGPEAGGPGGTCVCPECGAETEHETDEPCDDNECPECGAIMTRDADEAIRPELQKALAVFDRLAGRGGG